MIASAGERALFSALLLCGVIVLLIATLGLGAAARRVPLAVLLPTCALLIAQALRDLHGWLRQARQDAPEPAASAQLRLTAQFAWIALLPLLMFVSGPIAGPAIFVAAWLRVRAHRGLAATLAGAVAVAACAYAAIRVMGFDPRHAGLLWQWLS